MDRVQKELEDHLLHLLTYLLNTIRRPTYFPFHRYTFGPDVRVLMVSRFGVIFAMTLVEVTKSPKEHFFSPMKMRTSAPATSAIAGWQN